MAPHRRETKPPLEAATPLYLHGVGISASTRLMVREVDFASNLTRTVVFIKRSMGPGFSGVDNDLFCLRNTVIVLGDAKKVLTGVLASMRNLRD